MGSFRHIIYVTRHYHWLLEPVVHFHKKYFDVPLLFFSDRPILGQDYIQAFPYDHSLYEKPCGSMIKNALLEVDEPIVTIGMMDMLPRSPVDLQGLQFLANYMRLDGRVARGNLWMEVQPQLEHMETLYWSDFGLRIVFVPQHDPHIGQIGSTSLMPALWDRQFLLDFIEDDWTMDNIELPGQTKFAKQSRWHSIGTYPALFDAGHLCYTADKMVVRTSAIKDSEDRKYIEARVPAEYRIA